MPRINAHARFYDFGVSRNIFSNSPDVLPRVSRMADRDLMNRGSRLFFHYDRRHALWNGSSRQEAHSLSPPQSRRAVRAGYESIHDWKWASICFRHVIDMNAVTIDGALIERR